MQQLLTILFSLLFWHAPPSPTTYNFSSLGPYGLIPRYRFEKKSEEIEREIITNLIQTRVYKIEEVAVRTEKTGTETLRWVYMLSKSQTGDTLFIDRYDSSRSDATSKHIRSIYWKDGKFLIEWPAIVKDTSDDTKKIYDTQERLVEEDQHTFNYGIDMISRKELYNYDSVTKETETLMYELKEPTPLDYPPLPFPPLQKKDQDSIFKAARDSVSRLSKKLFTEWSQNYLSNGGEYELTRRVISRIDSVKRIHYISANFPPDTNPLSFIKGVFYYDAKNRLIKRELTREGRKNIERTDYVDDSKGHLLSLASYWNGRLRHTDKWKYDKNGRCIFHNDKHSRDRWKYDSKGNMIEFSSIYHGERSKSTYKIYYQ